MFRLKHAVEAFVMCVLVCLVAWVVERIDKHEDSPEPIRPMYVHGYGPPRMDDLDSFEVISSFVRKAGDIMSGPLSVPSLTIRGAGASLSVDTIRAACVGGNSSDQICWAPNATTATATGGFTFDGSTPVKIAGTLAFPTAIGVSSTAPTISSGFGVGASVTVNNGTFAFTINVGTGGTANAGVIGLPATTTKWVCGCQAQTPGVNITRMTAGSTNTCTVTNAAFATGLAAAWSASDTLECWAKGK